MAENGGTKVVIGGSGISLTTALTIVFVVLKLIGTIEWSWWWVLAPLWISAGLSIAIIGLVIGFMLVIALIAYLANR